MFQSYEPMGSSLLWTEDRKFHFEVGGMLECVISAVCLLGIPIPPLTGWQGRTWAQNSFCSEQSHCWCHAPANTMRLEVAQEWFPPAFPVAAVAVCAGAASTSGPHEIQKPHNWHQWVPSPPACLCSWFMWWSPICARGSSCNLFLISPCSVAASHSPHDLRSCFQLPKLNRTQNSCFTQGRESLTGLPLFC